MKDLNKLLKKIQEAEDLLPNSGLEGTQLRYRNQVELLRMRVDIAIAKFNARRSK